MIRSLAGAIAMAILLSPTALLAQEAPGAQEPQNAKQTRREAYPMSVSAGIGFLASIDSSRPRCCGRSQFLMQFDGLYSITNNVAAGVTLQAGPSGQSSTVAMSFDARVYFPLGDGSGNGDGFVGRLVPYAGMGMGFRTYTSDFSSLEPGTTDFLFNPTVGLEYDVSDNFSVTTDMRFNVTSGRDRFYYSWQLIGARFRF